MSDFWETVLVVIWALWIVWITRSVIRGAARRVVKAWRNE